MPKRRLDDLLVERGLATDREQAKRLLMSGKVFSRKGHRLTQGGREVEETLELEVRTGAGLRGSTKLTGPLDTWGFEVKGLTVADIGAAAGGFTSLLLERGARKVYAIDVGKSLLTEKLRRDFRVVVMDETNARYLESLPERVDLFVIDVSFISLEKILPAVRRVIDSQRATTQQSGEGAPLVGPAQNDRAVEVIALVKPQFEVGREVASRFKGVIKDERLQIEAVEKAERLAEELGFEAVARMASTLKGPKGNQEWFIRLRGR